MEFTAKELIELTKEIDQKCIDFAVGFALWIDEQHLGEDYNYKELVKIFKKEKGL